MKKLVMLALALVTVSGCTHSRTEDSKEEKAIKVKTARVSALGSESAFGYSGTVEASQVIPLSFRTIGTVKQVYVEVGDVVRKGQLLATLDDSELQSIQEATLAKYQQAEDAYNRLKQVHDQGSLPDIKWVEMQTSLEQARSSLDLSKSNLDKCKLISPIDGMVGRRNIEPGQSSVSLVSAPLELVRIEKVLVKISVPENEINRFKPGQKAGITVNALDGKAYEGTVANISPVAEPVSRTYTVKISVSNPGQELKPGMVSDVRMGFGSKADVLVVPARAVNRDDDGQTYVFLVSPDHKTVRKQPIEVGQFRDTGIEVISGLAEGQIVVCEGAEKLSDNGSITL